MGLRLPIPPQPQERVRLDDHVLAQRCVAGDRAAQHQLFHAHRRRVHATLYRIVGSNASMDDLLQDTFINVFRSLATYRGEALLATWIDRCAVRVAYAHIAQRRARMPSLELVPEIPAGDPSAERRALAREAARHLYAALDEMDPKQRTAFSLHAIDGRPLAEVAELMDASVVATQTRVWRARRALSARAGKDTALVDFISAGRTSGKEDG
ncbi:RNA polymerase sigma factor [Pendulispora rubella]|uniref:RNA polymerase sigma factor n=1 Tax=Pendulispora rubella TaxID=2741070 RepID=A0ABZ2LFK7_9BACT